MNEATYRELAGGFWGVRATMRNLSFQAKEGCVEMRTYANQLGRIERSQVKTRRTRSGRPIYGLHPSAGPRFWTASEDKLERRRIRNRVAARARALRLTAERTHAKTVAWATDQMSLAILGETVTVDRGPPSGNAVPTVSLRDDSFETWCEFYVVLTAGKTPAPAEVAVLVSEAPDAALCGPWLIASNGAHRRPSEDA